MAVVWMETIPTIHINATNDWSRFDLIPLRASVNLAFPLNGKRLRNPQVEEALPW